MVCPFLSSFDHQSNFNQALFTLRQQTGCGARIARLFQPALVLVEMSTEIGHISKLYLSIQMLSGTKRCILTAIP